MHFIKKYLKKNYKAIWIFVYDVKRNLWFFFLRKLSSIEGNCDYQLICYTLMWLLIKRIKKMIYILFVLGIINVIMTKSSD